MPVFRGPTLFVCVRQDQAASTKSKAMSLDREREALAMARKNMDRELRVSNPLCIAVLSCCWTGMPSHLWGRPAHGGGVVQVGKAPW